MKKVFNNYQLAHVWAQQNQEEGRSHNGNFHFSGDTLYSYSTPIARIVKGVALVTCESYSVTTRGKHIGPALSAVAHRPCFRVPFLGATGGRAFSHPDAKNMREVHKGNLAHYAKRYEEERARLMRCRDLQAPGTPLGGIASTRDEYIRAFKLRAPKPFPVVADAEAISAKHAARLAKRNSPKEIAKREREKIRREEKERAQHAALYAEIAANVDKWRAGENVPLRLRNPSVRKHYGQGAYIQHAHTLLRVNGEEVETSQGARFPLAHGKKAWPFIQGVKERGEGWQRNGHAIHLGSFAIDEITPDGDVRAGCHLVKFEEVERMAKELGL